ncbi:uncharacterized protein BDR25DRAFT_101805 [Lindgomyces ingoldianus]|uniref:Uncharacterized protein n=1 Tax=Lindgomyces ingoldianus TaxID=673940 RepID=A0ACB6R7U1_9PLEO|nr:uncharacterized protein BDR25DRAFT_101805 [Lindgomyces ingoldianus]KAF2475329.1 hypothetical protein BDR25DRAFT_101805 [Lindgomyces ingoldianus]
MSNTPSSTLHPPYANLNVLFCHPRTSSHLLAKILNLPAQPHIHQHASDGYFFLRPTGLRFQKGLAGKNVASWTEEEKEAMKEAFQKSYEDLEKFVQEAKYEGKGIYVKEHVLWTVEPVSESMFLYGPGCTTREPWYAITIRTSANILEKEMESRKSEGNETCLPDSFLRKLKPTFLIRHPALAFPSNLRTAIDNEGIETVKRAHGIHTWEMTYHWLRALYTWYDSHLPPEQRTTNIPEITFPILLDADDITNPSHIRRYTEAIGLDPSLLRYEWEAASEHELDGIGSMEKRMKETILKSTGIVKGKTSADLVIGDEKRKWREEFGDDLGQRLEGWVDGALEDWEWLRGRALRIYGS